MAFYEDFSKYKLNPNCQLEDKNLENVLNIGWLGEDGNFKKGNVSKEFLMNLWEYYKCPIYETRRLYNNEGLDGYWKFFTAYYNERTILLGRAEIRVIDTKRDVIYAAPELIIHYIVNHNYLPPEEFIDAVITGPKPNSEEFCAMVGEMYKNVHKKEHIRRVCPYCNSKYLSYVYREKKNYEICDELRVVDSDTLPEETIGDNEYIYFQLCESCGHLSEFELKINTK